MTDKSLYTSEFRKLMLKNPKMNFNNSATVSSILLFRDYLSRLKHLKLLLGIKEFYSNYEEFHNLFLDINPSWKDEMPSMDTFFESILKQESSQYNLSRTLFNSLFIYLFITWEVFKDKKEIKEISQFGNPYESAFKIIEDNHFISLSEGHFHIDNIIYLKKGQNKFLLPSLNDDFLRLIDKQYPIKIYGPQNIPKQEDIDLLWAEFNK
ncbi:hypothetical protein [Mucilaginibacter aquaedulcis]|uniref:hypothetical protein n=1 Tax=Mucilaginibacter aquaedulcis TaxID=1187081 RepID=UPI0025B2E71A|nr:hypothetical protein [Mucilaginibacter aquaedulcis]MDN3548818.1 hypothetical protein [Mucilaginibacter aquaedulcis]